MVMLKKILTFAELVAGHKLKSMQVTLTTVISIYIILVKDRAGYTVPVEYYSIASPACSQEQT